MDGVDLPVQINSQHLVMPRLDVYYPQVSGLANLEAQQKINTAIYDLLKKMIVDMEYYSNPRTEISGYYEIKTNQRGILSLLLVIDAYSGGIHGIRLMKAINTDVRTGRIYQLKDLFKEGSDYLQRLSAIVGQQIKNRGLYLLGPFRGIRPDQDFYIADKTIVPFFQLYEIAPYAAGFPQFPISVYDIKNMVNDTSPLKMLSY